MVQVLGAGKSVSRRDYHTRMAMKPVAHECECLVHLDGVPGPPDYNDR